MKKLFWALCLLISASCWAQDRAQALKGLPPAAKSTLPLLEQVQSKYWPSAPAKSLLAAQITKETCITFKHSKCLTARAELKTSREWGRGFGQITTAYNKDGSVRFDTMSEVKSYLPELRKWDDTSDPYNSYYHMVAFVGKMQRLHSTVTFFSTPKQKYAGALVSYNRGYGGLISDRNVCKRTSGCNPDRWFDNVEHTSNMQKTVEKGYGESFFQISRRYPRTIMGSYQDMYRPYFSEQGVQLAD